MSTEHLSPLQFKAGTYVPNKFASEYPTLEAYHGDQKVGRVTWSTGVDKKHYIKEIETHPEHRRKGVATALYNEANNRGLDLQHNFERTDAGEGWATSVGAKPRQYKVWMDDQVDWKG